MNAIIDYTQIFGASSSQTGLGMPLFNTQNGGVNSGGSSIGGGVLDVLGGSFVSDIIGSIGQLVSCWGSTWQPSRAENFIASKFPTFQANVQTALQTANPIEAVNQAVKDFRRTYSRDEAWLKRCEDSATGCSRDTLQAMTDQLLTAIKQLLTSVAPQINAKVVSTTYSHGEWNHPGPYGCGETFQSWKLERKSTIDLGLGGSSANGMKLFSTGLLLPFALLGTLAYWLFGNKSKKSKNQKKWFKN